MTDDIAQDQPWNDCKDTPEAREAVSRVQGHYLPVVKDLRETVETKNKEIDRLNKTITMQRMFMVCIALFSVYVVVFR